ncbi:MAG: asparagine--tRNA ligase [Planctomycetaceae bacterium]|nr:asparagine--tRNA ligase [Planctomycetaceae bacterium]
MSGQFSRVAALLLEGQPGTSVSVSGWVRTRRDSKQGFSFIELNDGSCMANLQVVVDADVPGYADVIHDVTTGSSLSITGELKESPGAKQRVELQASSIELLGTADAESYPLQKKRHSFEFLREIAHLRPRTNTFGAIARVRNCVCYSIHNFFQTRGFLNVQTPIITTSDCEGAGEMFTVTTLLNELRVESGESRAGESSEALSSQLSTLNWTDDFFGKRASLTVSGQLEAEIYATSLGPVYTFGPTFRAENSNTARHLAEFWMVEPEMPFCDLDGDMQLAEDFIKTIIRDALDQCADDMEFFNQRIEKTVLETLNNILEHEFKRISYTEAVDIITATDRKWEYPVTWGDNLQAEHERYLTEEHFKQPMIVFDYPRSIKPFYMYCNDDGKTVRAMDVLVPRVGEIIGGSQREHRLDVLDTRLQECGLDSEEYWWYRDLRRYGTVPHAGFGLGLERMLLLLTGMQNIRDVIPFPRTPKHAEF